MITLTPESPVQDHGTIIVFTGTDEEGRSITFGADRRPALDIIRALQSGEPEIEVDPDPWQILGSDIDG